MPLFEEIGFSAVVWTTGDSVPRHLPSGAAGSHPQIIDGNVWYSPMRLSVCASVVRTRNWSDVSVSRALRILDTGERPTLPELDPAASMMLEPPPTTAKSPMALAKRPAAAGQTLRPGRGGVAAGLRDPPKSEKGLRAAPMTVSSPPTTPVTIVLTRLHGPMPVPVAHW
jgi:hypothetical protein